MSQKIMNIRINQILYKNDFVLSLTLYSDQLLLKFIIYIKLFSIIVKERDMNSEIQGADNRQFTALAYLTAGNLNERRMQAAGKLTHDLVNMIELEIEENKLEVNDVQKQFKLKQKHNVDDPNKRISNLISKKHQIQGQLDLISKQEEKIRDLNLSRSNSERKYYKSQMTQEDIEKIKQLKIQRKKHQIEIQQKTKLYEQNLRKFQQQEKQLIQKQKKQKNQQRLKEVAKKIQEIRKRQQQRTKKIQQEKRKIYEITHQKKLHQKFEQHFKTQQQQQQRKKQQRKMVIKLQRKVDYDDLKQHEKKYDEIMRSQKEQRQKKMGQLSKGISKKYYCSKILKDVIQQQQKIKIEQVQKKNQIVQKYLKKNQYAQHIRNNLLPNMPVKEEEQDDKNNKMGVSRSVSVTEVHKMGNQYMKQVHQNLANLKGSSVSKFIEKKEEPFRYKDYLKDMKVQRKISSQRQGRYLQEIDNLMKKENMTQQQKFHKAKMITQKIEDKKGRNSQKLIQSINAKIHLLKQIQPSRNE